MAWKQKLLLGQFIRMIMCGRTTDGLLPKGLGDLNGRKNGNKIDNGSFG